ncbi:hypothetical protein REJC140_03825 [Pseudorhizobium endolithicum]|uniref:DUF982 domain-containing protein n=1 Tax=Pseudorhizobium endolithicum TaxID=1191678 RepID=A0ABM8PRI4_9HYPH|nr:DUF982 domain-containing protein [Pseudorhizobium endolithicum]CAD7044483.1 hypothetical protein REJC140_03825 [Pseudorhizobium endolithicum]
MTINTKVGREAVWRHPVVIRIGYGMREPVRGPAEAYHYLSYRWPSGEYVHLELARQKCQAATERGASSEEARELFITAAMEAEVLA